MSITKLQNLKAIHNNKFESLCFKNVVVNHKTTKFESNSQRRRNNYPLECCCCQSQNYKIWKQFTTKKEQLPSGMLLLSITKLQNLKAIHNNSSQRRLTLIVVVNHKTTKFESNSQRALSPILKWGGCCQSQNYKIWKQFTTTLQEIVTQVKLLSITKLQNLKAIHNSYKKHYTPTYVVVNHKTTKFESNSQLR